MIIPFKYQKLTDPDSMLSQEEYDSTMAAFLSDPSLTFRWQVARLGSRPGEFHPVKSAPLFESEEAAAPYIARLESKSAKRSKYGPASYIARLVYLPELGGAFAVYPYN